MKTRELKFRVWNGSEMVYDVTVGKFGVFYVNPSNNGLDPIDSASLTPLTTKYHDDTPVMQFTGLKDKNGVEIFEGDVIEMEARFTYDVRFEDAMFVCYHLNTRGIKGVKWGPLHRFFDPDFTEYHVAVIGNIYSNPELLK